MSDDKNQCGCGHDHGHEHDNDNDTGCGHGCGGCGDDNESQCGDGCGCSGGCSDNVIYISEAERDFLMKLAQLPFLPLARFIMKSSNSDHMESVALAPVYLNTKTDSMETVKATGAVLLGLEEKYLVTLDYETPLQNGDYSMYEESGVYQFFCSTVQDGAKQPGFMFDQPVLERGSLALTALGQYAVESLQ